jgi:hypothetical protein
MFTLGVIRHWRHAVRYRRVGMAVICSLLIAAWACPVRAHHSITAEFDPTSSLVLKGVITKVDWVNPHVYIYIDVKDASGTVTNWSLESGPPGMLRRGGVNQEKIGIGQQVTIDAYKAKDGSKALAFLRRITYADGHFVQLWVGDPSKPQE